MIIVYHNGNIKLYNDDENILSRAHCYYLKIDTIAKLLMPYLINNMPYLVAYLGIIQIYII